jgi:hypothetical protein
LKHEFAWDESLRRLEDWDLWLTLAGKGLKGVQVGRVLFQTQIRPGISWQNPLTHAQAEVLVRGNHGI